MDFEEYSQRLQTFTLENFPMAHYKLTPSKMARWGLIVADSKVQCSACFEIFEIPEEIQFHGELLRILQQLKTRHRVNCPYYDQAGFKVTRDFMHVHADSYFKECLMTAPEIPIILPELNEQMQTILTINGAISNQRAIALFGWQMDQGQLLCKFCGRKLLITDPFNVVEEHRYFCNWVNFNVVKESGHVILARQLYEQFITDEQQTPTEFVQIGAIRRQIAVQLDELHKESLEIGKFLFQIQDQNSGILDTMTKRKQFEEFKQQQQEFEERLEKKVKLNQQIETQQNEQEQKQASTIEQDISIEKEMVQQDILTYNKHLKEENKEEGLLQVERIIQVEEVMQNSQLQQIEPSLDNQQEFIIPNQQEQNNDQQMEIEQPDLENIMCNTHTQLESTIKQILDDSNIQISNNQQVIEANLEEQGKISQEQSLDMQNFAPSQQEEGYINSFQQFSMQSPEQQQLLQNLISQVNQDQSDKIELVYLERLNNQNEDNSGQGLSNQNEIQQFEASGGEPIENIEIQQFEASGEDLIEKNEIQQIEASADPILEDNIQQIVLPGDPMENNEKVELSSPQQQQQQEQISDNRVSTRSNDQQIVQEEQIEQANDDIQADAFIGADLSDNSLENQSLTGQAQNEQTIDQLSQEDGQEQEQDQQDQTIKQ